MIIENIMRKYNRFQIIKIKDFFLSEIEDTEINEIIEFVNANDKVKVEKFRDYLYNGKDYKGILLDGNQYLISSNNSNVTIIDTLNNMYSNSEYSTIIFDLSEFIFLLNHKKQLLNYCNILHE